MLSGMKRAWVAILLVICLPQAVDARRKRARTGTVIVRSATVGAVVYIDGQEVGTIPMKFPMALRAGKHTVKVSRQGHADYLDTFRIRAGRDVVLEIDLLAVSGILRVAARPPAEVVVDGRRVGQTPYLGELEPGRRMVEVRAPDYTVHSEEIVVAAGELYPLEVQLVPLPVVVPPAPTPWFGHWWVWAGAAVIVAGGVTAAVTLSDTDGPPPDPDHILTIEPQR